MTYAYVAAATPSSLVYSSYFEKQLIDPTSDRPQLSHPPTSHPKKFHIAPFQNPSSNQKWDNNENQLFACHPPFCERRDDSILPTATRSDRNFSHKTKNYGGRARKEKRTGMIFRGRRRRVRTSGAFRGKTDGETAPRRRGR